MVNNKYKLQSIKDKSYVLQDNFQGTDLFSFVKEKPMSVKTFLVLAIELTKALDVLHKINIIHADLSPCYISVNPDANGIMLSGFDITLNKSQEKSFIEKNQFYKAPEQSGRVGHKVSRFTDIYSLGTVFYYMLSGDVPFSSQDKIGLIHDYVAKKIPNLSEVFSDIPLVISNIVSKMMQKDPLKRYKTLESLHYDLNRCIELLSDEKYIKEFEIDYVGEISSFNYANRLYGVDSEISEIIDFASDIDNQSVSLLCMSGNSGVGKTTLVKSVIEKMEAKFSYTIASKFDQYREHASFEILYSPLQNLMKQILSEDEVSLEFFKTKLLETLGSEIQVLIEVIPEIEMLTGPQSSVEPLSALDSKARLYTLLSRFLQLFSSFEKPLCIFFEDLQWADITTLEWLKTAVLDLSNIFIIITYRDDEVRERDPLSLILDELKAYNANIKEIHLESMSQHTIRELISSSIYLKEVNQVSEIIFKKTSGNTLFVMQFLKLLQENNAIWFDYTDLSWHCDLEKMQNLPISNNVIELLEKKILSLPKNVQNLLKIASCIGSSFCEEELKQIYDNDAIFDTSLSLALEEEWILEKENNNLSSQKYYLFSHDRMQQTSHSLLSKMEKHSIHLSIGNFLLNKYEKLENENLFVCVDHFNKTIISLLSEEKLGLIAELNYSAALQAKKLGDFTVSLSYMEKAMDYMPKLLKAHEHSSIFKERAECEHLCNHSDIAIKYYNLALENSASTLQKAEIYEFLIKVHTDISEFDKAYKTGCRAAKLFDMNLPSNFKPPLFAIDFLNLKLKLGSYKTAQLLELPRAEDENIKMLIRILSAILKAAYQIKPELCVAISLKLVALCLKYGNTREAVVGYMVFGVIFQGGVLGNHALGYEYEQLSLKMLDKFNNRLQRAEVEFVCNYFANSWVKSSVNTEENWYKAYLNGLEIGDWFHTGCAAAGIIQSMFMRGVNLQKILEEIEQFEVALRRIGADEQYGAILSVKQAVLNFKALTVSSLSFSDKEFDEPSYVVSLQSYGSRHFAHYYFINKMISLYLHNEFDKALAVSKKSRKYMSDSKGMLHSSEHIFYNALIVAKLYQDAAPFIRIQYKIIIMKAIKLFKKYAQECPENFLARLQILEGELSYLNNKIKEAFNSYESALESSKTFAQIHLQAIVNMLIKTMYESMKQLKSAEIYAYEANKCFSKWGVALKTDTAILNDDYSSNNLDIATLIKATETIAQEQGLSNLLKSLIEIIIESAGAQYGMLLLKENDSLLIQAENSIDSAVVNVLQNTPYENSTTIVQAVVNYVIRSNEPIVLDNAQESSIFGHDASVIARDVKSVLCAPIIFNGELKGVIYLENNTFSAMFTKDKIELLKHLGGQIAISIENALMYDNLEKKVIERTHDLDAKNIELEEAIFKLDILASTDGLTHLNNRRSFDAYLDKECMRYSRSDKALALIICDVDFFKAYNDFYGHQKGDESLQAIAKVLSASVLRSSDFVARYGGEEFAIIMPETDIDGAMKIAEKIHDELKQLRLPHEKSNTAEHITISIGLALAKSEQTITSQRIIKIADEALYEAKNRGRNRTSVLNI